MKPIFAIAALPCVVFADVYPLYRDEKHQDGTLGSYPFQKFISEPDIIAPVPNIIVEASEEVSPNEFISWAPHGDAVPNLGPQFLDAKTLSLVYQAPTFYTDNFGFLPQRCNGSDYLIWWTGRSIASRSAGIFRIFDDNYQSVFNVSTIGLEYADNHGVSCVFDSGTSTNTTDLYLTPQCTAVITVSEPRYRNLTDQGIENGWILENWFQEIDLVTNELLFEWQASSHVNINDTFWNIGIKGPKDRSGTNEREGWDFFHINSVNKDNQGNYLVSSRHMSSLYYISGQTGDILWTLGGRQNDFEDLSAGKATDFAWQHNSRFVSDDSTKISVFDNRNCRYIKDADPVSRGLLVNLDVENKTASVAGEYRATSHIKSFRKGGMQYLENGNVMLGYGNEPAFTEYSPNGTVLWDVRFGPIGHDRDTADSYRVYKFNYTGNPTWDPKIAAGPSFDDSSLMSTDGEIFENAINDTAYFSWNGATRLSRWLLLASNHSAELTSVSQTWCIMDKLGFETSYKIGGEARYIRAIGLSKDNKVLGASPVLDMQTYNTTLAQYFSIPDFTAEWKQQSPNKEYIEAFEKNTEEENRWASHVEMLKEDWCRMKKKQKILVGVLCGGLFLIALVVGALTWHYRHEFGKLRRFSFFGLGQDEKDRGMYELADDERVSLDSIDARGLEFTLRDMEGVIDNMKNDEWRKLLGRS